MYLTDPSPNYLTDYGTFITDDDFRIVIGDTALKVISQVSEENRMNALAEAEEEIAGYLRPTYDTNAIFSAVGDDRNRLIVMHTVDIALYHMAASLPQKMGTEIRKERYERAIRWLTDVQSGKIVPSLPTATDTTTGQELSSITYGSQPKRHNNW